ncbi:hypothetical protein K438DRAFT_2100158 [Mycena galopus ATCC 62051]|nr:hypothetical protein K438DRAFT_2100158 [Mycena galopus ATCC 62051]
MTPGLRVPAGILVLVFPMHAMWFPGCVAGFIRRHRQRAASSVNGEGVVVQKAPEVGIGWSDMSGVERTKRHPLAPDVHADARSLAHHAAVVRQPWSLHRLRLLSSTLLSRGGQRWLSGPAGWVSPGVWLEAGERGGSLVAGQDEEMFGEGDVVRWLSPVWVGARLGRASADATRVRTWGLRKAILARLRTRRPIRPPATMMARRMSASLIAVLPKVPGREVLMGVRDEFFGQTSVASFWTTEWSALRPRAEAKLGGGWMLVHIDVCFERKAFCDNTCTDKSVRRRPRAWLQLQ